MHPDTHGFGCWNFGSAPRVGFGLTGPVPLHVGCQLLAGRGIAGRAFGFRERYFRGKELGSRKLISKVWGECSTIHKQERVNKQSNLRGKYNSIGVTDFLHPFPKASPYPCLGSVQLVRTPHVYTSTRLGAFSHEGQRRFWMRYG